MFSHIIIPLDESTRAEEAITVATRIAKTTHGSLTLLRIAERVLAETKLPVFIVHASTG